MKGLSYFQDFHVDEHYPIQKIGENNLHLILGALVGRARPKIW